MPWNLSARSNVEAIAMLWFTCVFLTALQVNVPEGGQSTPVPEVRGIDHFLNGLAILSLFTEKQRDGCQKNRTRVILFSVTMWLLPRQFTRKWQTPRHPLWLGVVPWNSHLVAIRTRNQNVLTYLSSKYGLIGVLSKTMWPIELSAHAQSALPICSHFVLPFGMKISLRRKLSVGHR